MNLDQAFERFLPLIERELRQCFEATPSALQSFYGMMSYHLGWLNQNLTPATPKVGKRLRPFLCLVAAQAVGGDPLHALPAGVTIELIHNFSLVHDDIQDNSLYRRHRKAVWAIWGQPHAINVGDGLFAMAFLHLTKLNGLTAERMRRIYESCASACLLLCEGQYMDMSFETRSDVTEAEYIDMIGRKTAALLSCATYIGALVGNADDARAEQYRAFGQQLGLAFQIQDDILGIWGDPAITGKPVADDILQHKKTLPILYALRRESELGQADLRRLYAEHKLTASDVEHILALLDQIGARDYVRHLNESYCASALAVLKTAQPSPESGNILEELIDRLRDRPA